MTSTNITRSRRMGFAPLLALMLATAAFMGLRTTPAHAGPIGWTAAAGWYTEADAFFLSGGARIGFGTLTFHPNAEYIFVDNGTSYSLNLDGTLNIIPLGVATGWVGAGLGFYFTDPDPGSSQSETGVNLLAGASLNATKFKPYVQLKYVVIDGNDPVALSFGVCF